MKDRRALATLERVAYGAVAVTALALGEVGLDVTFPQWRVLVVVGERPEGATVSEIAERVGAAISPASRLVTRLRRRGFVATGKDPADRRVTRVRLTDAGAGIRERVLARRRTYLGAVLESAGPLHADAEAALARIADAFERYT